MIKKFDRVPLSNIQEADQSTSPVKNTIKILKKKLPLDFFTSKTPIYSLTSIVKSPPSTSSHHRKLRINQSPQREVLTAREYTPRNNDEQLIFGVLHSARQIKRVFRKHSMEMDKTKAHSKHISEFNVQLPPLLLRKANKPTI